MELLHAVREMVCRYVLYRLSSSFFPGSASPVAVALSVGIVMVLATVAWPVWGFEGSEAVGREPSLWAFSPAEGQPLNAGLLSIGRTQAVTETVPQQPSGWAGAEGQTGQQGQSGWSGEVGQTPQPQSGWSGEVSQTPQPQPPATGAEPVPPAQVPTLPDWPLLVWDDFRDPATGWSLWSKNKPPLGSYTDDMMQIAFEAEPGTMRNPMSVHEFQDFRVDVDVRTVGTDEGVVYGLFLRYGDGYEDISYYYFFRIQADGSYVVFVQDGTEVTLLHQAAHSSCIFTGPEAVNHLTVVAQGSRMDFYANGCYLTSVTDDRVAEGDIGLGAGRIDKADRVGPVDVRFDNFRVYTLQPYKPAVWGDVSISPLDRDELVARGEFLHLWPFPAESATQFPGGTKLVHLYIPHEGMTSAHQFKVVTLLDGQEILRQEHPWSHYVTENGVLGFGVYMHQYFMTKGADLLPGRWESRLYVEDVPVARSFFSIGVDTPPPTPEPLDIRSVPPLPPPSLPPAEESFRKVVELYTQGRYTETLPYCELAMAVAPNSTQLMVESAKCYEAAGDPEWAQMLRQMAENLVSKRSDVAQGTGQVQEQIPSASPVPPAQPVVVGGPQEVIGFHSNQDGNWEVYVMSPDGSGMKRLTENEALDAALRWSPDGQRITFTSDREGNRDVFMMNADGSGVTNISRNPALDSDSSWWPDGSKIVFESDRSGDYEIWVMDAGGSNAMNLSNTPGGDGKPVVSPDGTKIAFESARDGNVENS